MKYAGLIADTHLEKCTFAKMHAVFQCFRNVQLILHAGDITDVSVLQCLESIAPVHAVRGNMDFSTSISGLPERRIVTVGGFRVGLVHGWGSPIGIQERVRNCFSEENVSVIVYGHSHLADVRNIYHCLMVNPGSAFDRRYAPFCSVGILAFNDKNVSADIVRLPD